MTFLKDLWQFIRERKKFWLLPVILILVIIGIITILAGGTALGPFIYTLF